MTFTERYVCIGLPKSGTTSLEMALRNCGMSVHANPYDVSVAHAFQRGNFRVFDLPGMERFNVISELPASAFYPDIVARYPSARVIHLVREKEDWLESCRKWWGRFSTWDLELFDTLKDEKLNFLERRALSFFQTALFGLLYFDADRFARVYEEHTVRAARLFGGSEDYLRLHLEEPDVTKGEILANFIGRPLVSFSRMNVEKG